MIAVRRFVTSTAVRRIVAPRVNEARHFTYSSPLLSQYSSFAENEATLFKRAASQDLNPLDAQLRADVRTMGSLLGQIIRDHNGQGIYDKVEVMRSLAKAWREAGAGRVPETAEEAAAAFKDLSSFASSLSDEDLFLVSRAFTHFLAIANAAEGHHRIRRLQDTELIEGDVQALSNKPDSCGGVLPGLAKTHDKDSIWEALTRQCVELVLTAHPTEVNRRTILNKQRRVQQVSKQYLVECAAFNACASPPDLTTTVMIPIHRF